MSPQSFQSFLLSAGLAVAFTFPAVYCRANDGISSLKDIPLSDDYVLRSWDVDEGLPGSNVLSIAQTPDGYLWLATSAGLARFDGVRFTSFSADSTPGLQSDRWQIVFTDRSGALWVGVEGGGISRRCRGQFEIVAPIPPRDSPHPPGIASIAEDGAGSIWFGYAGATKVARWRKGGFSDNYEISADVTKRDTFLKAAANGTLWYAVAGVCGAFDGQRFHTVDFVLGSNIRLAAARDSGMWGIRLNDLVRYGADGKVAVVTNVRALGGAANISTLYEDDQGNLWMGTTTAGLFRYRNGVFVRVPTSHTDISSIFEDQDSDIWVGTEGGGLNCLRQRQIFLRQTKNGLHHTLVTSLCEDSEGKLWVLGRDGIPVRALDSTNSSFATPPDFDSNLGLVVALSPDPAGGIWLALATGGVAHWRQGATGFTPIKEKTTALIQDHTGDLWVATISGPLLHMHKGTVTPVSTDGGLVDARALAEDDAGRLWVGTDGGLVFRRENNQFVRVALPGVTASDRVQFIVADNPGQVWFGLERSGLYRWRNGKIDRLPSHPNIPITHLRSMLIEPGGEFWIGTSHGLFRVQRSELDAVIEGRQDSMRCDAFGRSDGLPHMEFSMGYRNAITRTHDGHIWFGSYCGAVDIAPLKPAPAKVLQPVLIEEIDAGDTVLPLSDGKELTLAPNPGPIQIHYTLPELGNPERLRFRYRLIGQGNGEWISAGSQRVATLTNLLPRHFRFEVEACDTGGPWSPPAAVEISVKAAWWQMLWFKIGATFACFATFAFIAKQIERRRLQRRMRALEEQHALDHERARIAKDMHDEVGAILTRLAIMSERAAAKQHLPPESKHEIGAIAGTARSSAVLLDEIVWMVNPRNDTLDHLIGYIVEWAGEFLAPTGIQLELDVPVHVSEYSMSSGVRRHILLAIKEALNNVAKHARAKSVHLQIALAPERLLIVISDDGRGFRVTTTGTYSNGLVNSKNRLDAVGGTYNVESEPGAGTIVTFTIPLPHFTPSLEGRGIA